MFPLINQHLLLLPLASRWHSHQLPAALATISWWSCGALGCLSTITSRFVSWLVSHSYCTISREWNIVVRTYTYIFEKTITHTIYTLHWDINASGVQLVIYALAVTLAWSRLDSSDTGMGVRSASIAFFWVLHFWSFSLIACSWDRKRDIECKLPKSVCLQDQTHTVSLHKFPSRIRTRAMSWLLQSPHSQVWLEQCPGRNSWRLPNSIRQAGHHNNMGRPKSLPRFHDWKIHHWDHSHSQPNDD